MMLDTGLIINVVVGIFAYKGIVAIIEFTLLKLLAILLGKQIKGSTRKERTEQAIKLAKEELKKTELN